MYLERYISEVVLVRELSSESNIDIVRWECWGLDQSVVQKPAILNSDLNPTEQNKK